MLLNFLAQVITTQLSKSLLGRNDNMSNNVNDSISADNDSISRCSNNAGEENQINYSALMAMHTVIVVFAPVAVVGNAVVLMAVWKRSFQRTTFHTLLTVLALTDWTSGPILPYKGVLKYREEKSLRHVALVAKFLDDSEPIKSLKSLFALLQTSPIFFSFI